MIAALTPESQPVLPARATASPREDGV